MNIFEKDEKFKKNVGEFILTFSEIEFSLGMLVAYLENDTESNPLIPEVVGLSLEKKRERLRKALKSNDSLYKKWESLENRLMNQNKFRRFLSHGIVMNHVVNESLQGLIKAKPQNGIQGFHFKEITNADVEENLAELIDINSGEEGIGVLTTDIKGLI